MKLKSIAYQVDEFAELKVILANRQFLYMAAIEMTISLPTLKKADALKRSIVGSSAFNNFMSGTSE